MGIRPSFYILVGIDDAKKDDSRRVAVDEEYLEDILYFRELTRDECWREDDLWDDYHEWELKIPGATLDLRNKLYNPTLSSEFHAGNIIGYVVHRGDYDDDILRAFATLDDKYLSTGWERIPELDPAERPWLVRRGGYSDHDIACHRFVDTVFESMVSVSRIQWKRAMHYLKLVGWDIPETDLRYLLIWDWS